MAASWTHRSLFSNRRMLVSAALLLGLAEFADSFFISFWEGAAVFAALFLLAALWTRRGGIGGPILTGALCIFELQSFPTWKRTGLEDWISQSAVAVVSALCLLIAVGVLIHTLGTRKQATGLTDEAAG